MASPSLTALSFALGALVGAVLVSLRTIPALRRARGQSHQRARAVDAAVAPVRDELRKLHEHLRIVARDRARGEGALSEALNELGRATTDLRSETQGLRSAMRDVRVRGSWGELQLRRVVELAGMVEHCDFESQRSVSGSSGPLRPDLVVTLPGGRSVVVDAKVPLDAFLQAAEAPDASSTEHHRRRHAASMLDHARALGRRRYPAAIDGSLDYVVMFVPGESFLAAACEADGTLIERALDHGVVLATPTTLVALLRAVSLGWREQRVADHATVIAELGTQLYDRICVFSEHLDSVGRSLGAAVDGYNRAVGSFESRLVPGARKLAEHGASSSRGLEAPSALDTATRVVADAAADELPLQCRCS